MNSSPAKGRWYIVAIIFVLWMASLVIGLYALYSLQETVLTLYALSGGREQSIAGLLRWVALAVGGLAWLIAMLAGGEYHLKHAGERKSWIILAWTFGIEALIIVIGLLV